MNALDTAARDAAIRRLTAVRVYQLWENQGRPNGRDLIDWRQAEQEMTSNLSDGAGTRTPPPTPDRQGTPAPTAPA